MEDLYKRNFARSINSGAHSFMIAYWTAKTYSIFLTKISLLVLFRRIQLRAALKKQLSSGRMREMLARAKSAIAIIDPHLSKSLVSAWPNLEGASLDIEPLSEQQSSDLDEKPRRFASETKAGKRQMPKSR